MTRRLCALAPLLLLVACGSSGSGGSGLKVTGTVAATGTGEHQAAAIEMRDNLTFVPNVVTAQVGTLALSVRNAGRVPHDLVFAQAGLGSLSTVSGGRTGTLSLRFAQPGTYTFTCTIHHGMDGKVVVTAAS